MPKIRAYILGMIEFRLSLTTSFDWPLIETYDAGRERMHRLTFRHWDER
jgi:hypothetical protein